MKKMRNSIAANTGGFQAEKGFTLVEVLISMVVATVLIGAIYSSYVVQQKAYNVQRDLARMENCLRASMQIIRSDLLNSGRSEAMDGQYGVMDGRRYNQLNFNTLDATANGFQGITLTMAMDLGNADTGDPIPDAKADYLDPAALRTIQYRLIDTNNDGRRKLYRFDSQAPAAANDPVVGGTLLCDCIDDIGFAFSIDRENDEVIDRVNIAPNPTSVIWAADVNNDGKLDTNLDSDGSGTITPADAGGVNIAPVSMSSVRSVYIWLLARSSQRDLNYHDGKVYQVGLKTIDPDLDNTANFRRMLLSSTVTLRNRERKP